jgi:hypothetical protein
VAGDGEDLGAGALLGAELGVPVGAALEDDRERREGLDVVDERRRGVEAGDGREGGLQARLAALALEALQQPGLLAADVRPGAAVEGDVERLAGAERVRPEVARLVGLGERVVEDPGLVLVLAAPRSRR